MARGLPFCRMVCVDSCCVLRARCLCVCVCVRVCASPSPSLSLFLSLSVPAEEEKPPPPPKKKGLLSLLFSFGKNKRKLTKAQKQHLRKTGKLPPELDGKNRRRRRPPPKYNGDPRSFRVRNPRRMDQVVEVSKSTAEGFESPAIRGLLRSEPPPRRARLKKNWVTPIWGWRNWMKRRKPRMPKVELKVNSGFEQVKKRIEARRLNSLYHVTLPPSLEAHTRRAGCACGARAVAVPGRRLADPAPAFLCASQ